MAAIAANHRGVVHCVQLRKLGIIRNARIIPLRYSARQIRAQAPDAVADLRAAIYKTGIYQR